MRGGRSGRDEPIKPVNLHRFNSRQRRDRRTRRMGGRLFLIGANRLVGQQSARQLLLRALIRHHRNFFFTAPWRSHLGTVHVLGWPFPTGPPELSLYPGPLHPGRKPRVRVIGKPFCSELIDVDENVWYTSYHNLLLMYLLSKKDMIVKLEEVDEVCSQVLLINWSRLNFNSSGWTGYGPRQHNFSAMSYTMWRQETCWALYSSKVIFLCRNLLIHPLTLPHINTEAAAWSCNEIFHALFPKVELLLT